MPTALVNTNPVSLHSGPAESRSAAIAEHRRGVREQHEVAGARQLRRLEGDRGRVWLGGEGRNITPKTGGNRARAARRLGIARSSLYGLLDRYGLR